MNKPHHQVAHSAHAKTPPKPLVEVTFVFRDAVNHPIEGLSVRIAAGTGAAPSPAWKVGADTDDAAAAPAAASSTSPPDPGVVNSIQGTTDKDGYGVTIHNVARSQPIDVLVKNRHGDYALKGTVTPSKDVSAFTVISPEYHLEAVTQLTPKDAFEQDLNIPVVKNGEVMTIERLVNEFGPYIGWVQKITEQGKVKKDVPTKKQETHTDAVTGKAKTEVTIEHHYKVVDTGKPRTIALNVLGSRLNYPKSINLTDEHFQYLAQSLGCDAAAIKALNKQETVGKGPWKPDGGFDANGLPRILFERHHFFDFTSPPINKKTGKKPANPYLAFPDICFPKSGGFGASGMHQYERFAKAGKLDLDAAIQSSSWGAFQVLGEYYKGCGCNTSMEMANEYMKGIDNQVKMFEAFMKNVKPNVVKALTNKDWRGVAATYNGLHWEKHNPDYATDLEEYFSEFKK